MRESLLGPAASAAGAGVNHLEMADELIRKFDGDRLAEELIRNTYGDAPDPEEMTLMAHIGAAQELVIWAEEEVKKAHAETNPDKFANLAYSAWKIEAGARLLVSQLKVHMDSSQ